VGSLDADTRRELGQLLRELRRREGLTLSALSDVVGVSQSALSQFESGRAEPSLGTLWRLGRALNASLFDFFANEPARSVDVTSSAERTVMVYERARYEGVARSGRRKLDLFFLHLQPGQGPVREPVSHAGEEVGAVISGAMEVTVADETHRLETGDGIWFVSTQPHTFTVIGDRECVSVWADTLPEHAPEPRDIASILADHHPDRSER
jgi:transcriptional regulator with XRE-family HTH domain